MGNKYKILYVDKNNEMLSFYIEASSWKEIKKQVDRNLPADIKYVLGVHYVRTSYTEIE